MEDPRLAEFAQRVRMARTMLAMRRDAESHKELLDALDAFRAAKAAVQAEPVQ